MRILLLILLSLFLVGCANPLTRLLPKLEKLEVDPDLMKAPQPLILINKPSPEQIKLMMEEQEKQKAEAAKDVPPK